MQKTGRDGKDKLFNFRPIFFTAAFLCLGVVFAFLHIFYALSYWWLSLLLGLAIPFAFCDKERLFKTAISVAVLLIAFFVGVHGCSAQVRKYASAGVYEGEYAVQGVVEEKVVGKELTSLLLSEISVGNHKEGFKLIAYLPTAFCENVRLFDEVELLGTVQTSMAELSAESFDAYALQAGVKYKMADVESCVVKSHRFHLFGVIRERVGVVLYSGMDEDPAAVTLAVLTGDTSGIDSGLLKNMRYGGIAHVFAVSGLHVGALYAFCMLLTSKTGLKKAPKPVRFALVAATLLFYGGVCGFSSSVLRATVLCLVAYAAKLIGTSVDKFEALGAAAIFILLLSPVELFGVGFQLSFLACLGIFLWSKPLEKWGTHVCDELQEWTRVRVFRKTPKGVEKRENGEIALPTISAKIKQAVISFLAVSTAAQIATAPVLLQTFGYLSGWSALLNCIFVPFVGGIFSVLLLLVVFACALPLSVAPILLYLPNVVWSAALLLFEAFDFSLFAIRNVTLSVGAFVCYYLALSFLSDKWNLTARARKCFGALCAVGCVLVLIILNI